MAVYLTGVLTRFIGWLRVSEVDERMKIQVGLTGSIVGTIVEIKNRWNAVTHKRAITSTIKTQRIMALVIHWSDSVSSVAKFRGLWGARGLETYCVMIYSVPV